MIVSAPGRIHEPIVTGELSSMVDLFSTVSALAGCADAPRQSGRPLLDADLTLFPEGKREQVFAEWDSRGEGPTSSLRCIRTRDFKLVHYGRAPGEGEFYDLQEDPHEFFNQFHHERLAAERTELKEALCRHYLTQKPHVPCEGAW